MGKNKNHATPAPAIPKPAPLLDTALADELAGLEKLAAKAVKGEEVKVTDDAITALALTRELLRNIEDEKKAAIEKHLPKEVKDKLDRLNIEAKALKTRAETVEGTLVGALHNAVTAKRITESVTTSTGCQLILQHRKEVVIDDVNLLPEAFTLRTANTKAIADALAEHELKRGAAILLQLPEPESPVPGAHIGAKIVLVTKLPELIED